MYAIIIMTVVVSIGTVLLIKRFFRRKHNLCGKHVFITGGSKGIGKSFVVECIKLGANVSIVARDEDVLEELKIDLLKNHVNRYGNATEQKIMTLSLDVTSDYFSIEKAIEDAESVLGPIYMVINCAGTSMSAKFADTNLSDFQRMMDINYYGSVKVTKAVVNSMRTRISGKGTDEDGGRPRSDLKTDDGGVILFVSSISGLLGLFGYSAYSGSKFAVVGLAEVLAMELKSFGIKVCVCFPPDTDTPGFEEENKSKVSSNLSILEQLICAIHSPKKRG